MADKTPPSARQALRRAHRQAREFHGQRAVPLLQRGAHQGREGCGPHADAAARAGSAFLAATVAAGRAGSAFLAATVAAARAGSATRRRNISAGADLRALRCTGESLRANGRYDGSDAQCPWGRPAGRSGAGATTRTGTASSGTGAAGGASSRTSSSTSPRASRCREQQLKLEVPTEAHARGLTPSDGACSSTDVVKLDRHNRVT